jgi:cell division protein FtsQ
LLKDRSPRRRPEAHNHRYRGTSRQFRWTIRWPLVLALLPLVFAAAGTYAALNSSLLTVHEVRVEGVRNLDHAALAQISGLTGANMLTLSEDGASRRLLAIPDIRAIDVQREWPNTVVLTIEERRPVAFWNAAGHDFPVDQEGVVLSGGTPEGPAPRIVETTPGRIIAPGDRVHPDALAFAQRIQAESPRFLDARVSELEYRAGVGVTVIFEGGMRVTFGDDRSYEYKIAVLSELLQELANKGIQPSAVDLRFGERVTYE